MKRGKSYDQDVSNMLSKGPKVVASYLLGLLEADDELTVEEALRLTISRMGIKEFCELAGSERTNVTNFVNGKRTLGPKALNAYLKPFGLEAKVVLQKAS